MEFKNKKSLGQNFLIDKNILKKIISIAKVLSDDKVLEIGPGSGNLTKYIIDSKPKYIKVVEKDSRLIKILEKKFKGQIKIVHNDILKLKDKIQKININVSKRSC